MKVWSRCVVGRVGVDRGIHTSRVDVGKSRGSKSTERPRRQEVTGTRLSEAHGRHPRNASWRGAQLKSGRSREMCGSAGGGVGIVW